MRNVRRPMMGELRSYVVSGSRQCLRRGVAVVPAGGDFKGAQDGHVFVGLLRRRWRASGGSGRHGGLCGGHRCGQANGAAEKRRRTMPDRGWGTVHGVSFDCGWSRCSGSWYSPLCDAGARPVFLITSSSAVISFGLRFVQITQIVSRPSSAPNFSMRSAM